MAKLHQELEEEPEGGAREGGTRRSQKEEPEGGASNGARRSQEEPGGASVVMPLLILTEGSLPFFLVRLISFCPGLPGNALSYPKSSWRLARRRRKNPLWAELIAGGPFAGYWGLSLGPCIGHCSSRQQVSSRTIERREATIRRSCSSVQRHRESVRPATLARLPRRATSLASEAMALARTRLLITEAAGQLENDRKILFQCAAASGIENLLAGRKTDNDVGHHAAAGPMLHATYYVLQASHYLE